MDYNRDHVESRLNSRELAYTAEFLASVAQRYSEDTAVVLGKVKSPEGMRYGYNWVILIVRNSRPVTIMTRRQGQNMDKRNFEVNKVVYL
jgi:hypothetical protein